LTEDAQAWVRWIVTSVTRSIERAAPDLRRDIILIQLGRDMIAQDLRHLGIDVSWNTERRLREMQTIASNPAERDSMEWNEHYYAQPPETRIGDPIIDPAGAACRERCLRSTGLWYEDGQPMPGLHDLKVWDAYSDALVQAAKIPHDEGVLERIIGRDVPVFLNDNLNGPEDLQELNRRANPSPFHERLDRWSLIWHAHE
jgi:hypothetical protein